MANTPGGLPYPVGTDLVVNGDDAIKNLALALDSRIAPVANWTAYTPTWGSVAGTAPSFGNGSIVGRYGRVGRIAHFIINLNIGATGANGGTGAWYWTLPFAPAGGLYWQFNGWVLPGTNNALPIAGRWNGVTNDNKIVDVVDGKGIYLNAGYPLNAGAILILTGTYEAVS